MPEGTLFRTVTDRVLEQVLLVSVAFKGSDVDDSSVAEMTRLVESAGGTVAGHVTQKRQKPDAGFFVGRGKALEIASEASLLDLSTVVIDHDLSPGQVNRLEKTTGCKVIDRTELILAIFAVGARTPQAKLRIELAQLNYMLPRLSGMWHHLDRLGAGIGTRGPGETQLEVDRRRARSRIASLERRLKVVETGAGIRKKRRSELFSVAMAGYTNAGKSTLMNALCDAGVPALDRLFATLDTTSRRLSLPCGDTILLSDTVGFIRDIPKNLLASFDSTLDVVRDADLILLVADCSKGDRVSRLATVNDTLERIGAADVPRLTVWNKADLAAETPPSGLAVSALNGTGLDSLLEEIAKRRMAALDWCRVEMDICTGEMENWIRTNSVVKSFQRNERGGAEVICGFFLGASTARNRLAAGHGGCTVSRAPVPAAEPWKG